MLSVVVPGTGARGLVSWGPRGFRPHGAAHDDADAHLPQDVDTRAHGIASCQETGLKNRRGRSFWGPAVFVAALCTYVLTVAPSVLSSDSAEFQFVAHVWGVPHPTGYPTYVYLSKLFTLLPFGELAWRVNLLSVVFGAFSAWVLFRLALLLGAREPPAAAGALCLAFGRTFWSQGVVAEVHTLNTFLLGLLLFLALRLGRRYSPRDLWAWTGVAALAMGNHASTTILLPILAWIFLRRDTVRAHWRELVAAFFVLLALVLVLYAYVPLRALPRRSVTDLFAWDVVAGVWDYMSGGQFQGRMLAYGPGDQPTRLAYGLRQLGFEAGWVGLPLALIGIPSLKSARERYSILAMGLVIAVYAMNYDVRDSDVFFVPAHFVVALFASLGLDRLWQRGRDASRAQRWALGLALVLLPLGLLLANHAANDRSADFEDGRWGRATLALLEPEARIFLPWERRCTLVYLQVAEGLRPDVQVHGIAGYRGRLAELARSGPVYRLDATGSLVRVLPD